MTFGSLFAGIGGMDLGLERAGMQCVWQVEIDEYCRRVLEKHWPSVRRHDDVRTFPPRCGEWKVDCIAGGFPCQDISNAGRKAGIDGERSGLWREFHRVVLCLRPQLVIVENVAAILVRGIGRVLGDLAASGYDAEWGLLPACAFGAPHTRERLFIIANANKIGRWTGRDTMSDAPRSSHWKATQGKSEWSDMECWLRSHFQDCYGDADSSSLQRVDEWFPARVDRCGAIGNAVVPQVAEWIGRRIMEAS